MKESIREQQKVSLIFYSEEEGKRTKVDKWNIQIGKKYTIGRSKKKVDIIIHDITISRIQAEFIFYDKDKIMIKDFNSSNGTFINKEKIEPNKEIYFSAKDILSIGDEKKELIFEVTKETKKTEEEKNIRDSFDDKKLDKGNKKNGTKNKNYDIEKNRKIKKNSSEHFNRDSPYKKYDKYDKKNKSDKNDKDDDKYIKFDKEDKNYRNSRYYRYDKKDRYDKYDKDDKYKNRTKKYSRSRSISHRNSYDKKDSKYNKYSKSKKRKYSKYSNSSYSQKGNMDNSWKKEKESPKDEKDEDKKSKNKNISSYIIKKDSTQEEEIEKENDKKQIELYNEYLKLKKEYEENNKKTNLPSLLPLLVPLPKDNDSIDDDYEEQEGRIITGTYKRRSFRPRSRRRFRIIHNNKKKFIGMKRRGGYTPRYRGRRTRRNFYK